MARYKKDPRGYYRTTVWDGTYKNGKKHRKTITSKTMDGLTRAVDEYRIAQKTGNIISKSTIPFYDYAMKWLALTKTNVAPTTKEFYDNNIKHLKTLTLPVSDVNYSYFQAFLNDFSDRPRTQGIVLMILKQVVKYAEKDHVLPRGACSDIFTGISTTKYKAPPKRPLTDVEKACIFKADFSDREKMFVMLLYGTGIRRSEAVALKKSDFKNNEIIITKAAPFVNGKPYQKVPKSDQGTRTIPVPEHLKVQLTEYISKLDSEYLFTTLDGRQMTKKSYNCMWRSIISKLKACYIKDLTANVSENKKKKMIEKIDWDEVGIDNLTAHIFRHNYCTMLCYEALKGNISTKKIAELLGDTELMVLQVYSHIVEKQEKTLPAIESAFGC